MLAYCDPADKETMRDWKWRAGFLRAMAVCVVTASAASAAAPIVVDYFFEPGCAECEKIDTRILPALEAEFSGRYVLLKHDMGIETNVLGLLRLEKSLGVTNNTLNCMYVERRYPFYGFSAMQAGLLATMRELASRGGNTPAALTPTAPLPQGSRTLALERVGGLTTSVVAIGGLLDGVNPCAISTLVFFMSLLAVARVRRRHLLAMGLAFCLASFVAYTALGFGLLRALHMLDGFLTLRRCLEIGMAGLLGVLAYLSFRDALRYGRSHDAHSVTLQLPKRVKVRIHAILREGVRMRSIALGGLVAGFAVTVLESVCTGQVYVPTLVFVIKHASAASGGGDVTPGLALRAWKWLLLYNAMFMVPLVTVFAVTYLGVRTNSLLSWSRRNVVASKVLLGLFFVCMGILIVVM